MKTTIALGAVALLALPGIAAKPAASPNAVAPPAAAEAPWPEAYLEIFKLAPGKQEAFIRDIARADEVSAAGGQPPIKIFLHEDGVDWDVMLYKPETDSKPTPEQQAAMDAKRKALNMPSGPAYFVHIREMIASHTDTKAYGPISAAQWIAKLDAWRAAHPDADDTKVP
ncbi:hypothetical protein [Sphingomonas oryzagri]|jgi:hypothetical protein|uniref:Uncharacterized protein n=1 Tax=Sphingomonas oryzagri TaxID=3042314 RepID=A0ABT6MY69_9SPHN|nr:hypothetical protein [Sphingomonas oryzagri]MDH7637721.1 hypothetical protein [Sphingomonas oryzagri]